MAGDQPAVIMDLVDEVRMLGFPAADPGRQHQEPARHKRPPETRRASAEAHGSAEDDHVLRRRH